MQLPEVISKINGTVLVHATNINGLGARQVINSLMPHLWNRLRNTPTQFWIPEGRDENFSHEDDGLRQIRKFRRLLPYSASRFFECYLSQYYFPKTDRVLVLGDIPLYGFSDQVVFVEQLHLASPKINQNVSNDIHFKILRFMFKRNLRFAKYLVVQNRSMMDELIASYPELDQRIQIVPLPVPDWFRPASNNSVKKYNGDMTLFYPAANYPHKNHAIFSKMDQYIKQKKLSLKMDVTLAASELSAELKRLPWLNPVGRLSPEACLARYKRSDGLFFPSVLEAYGLPLVEAMAANLPVICSDLPYARWLCEDQAIYFDPFNGESACMAIEDLHRRLASGLIVDWTNALSKIPRSWDEVACRLLRLL